MDEVDHEELKKMAQSPVGPTPSDYPKYPAMRQDAFDNYETTDDHSMLIVGLAKDQEGHPFTR